MSEKKFDYHLTIAADYKRTFSKADEVGDMVFSMLKDNGFQKVHVTVGVIKK
jgi:hypothetical protein